MKILFPYLSYRSITAAVMLLAAWSISGAELRLDVEVQSGRVNVRFPSESGSYYILWQGNAVNDIRWPMDLALGGEGERLLSDTNSGGSARFYQVEKVSMLAPHDTDGDGIDDVWELQHRLPGAALDPADAEEDHNGNGVADSLDYLQDKLRSGAARSRPAISTGYLLTLGLRTNGSLWAWGDNYSGELGIGSSSLEDTNIPVPVGIETNWIAVSAGNQCGFGVRADGTLWAWGLNSGGRLGLGTLDNVSIPTQVGTDHDWVAVSSASYFVGTLALKADGSLWAWTTDNAPRRVGSDTDWVGISAGGIWSLAIKADGTLWGGFVGFTSTPAQVGGDTNWASVASGGYHTLATKTDGTLWAWSNYSYQGNSDGQLGVPGYPTTPTQVGTETNWVAVAAGYVHSLGLKSDGTLWAWGANGAGQLGTEGVTATSTPTQVGAENDWVAVSAGYLQTVALKADGTLVAWGQNAYGELGIGMIGHLTKPTQIGIETNWASVAAGLGFSMAIQGNGCLWAWGGNSYGQLGIGFLNNAYIPARVGTDTNWVASSGGARHSLGVKSDGSLWAWGDNKNGRLGNGTLIGTNVPIRIGIDTNWSAVSAGLEHSLGLKADGGLWAWGRGDQGALGTGSYSDANIPTRVGTNTDWIAAVAGYYETIALASNARLWACGQNDNGQLALDSLFSPFPPYYAPSRVSGGANWISFSSAKAAQITTPHTLAVKRDGTLWAWGYNQSGQLGNGSTTSTNQPTRIGTDTNWLTVAAGQAHSIGLKTDGTLWAWGSGSVGQLGVGNRSSSLSPVQVGTDTDWRGIAAGSSHTLAIKTNGTLWVWGNNSSGQAAQPAIWLPTPLSGNNWGSPKR